MQFSLAVPGVPFWHPEAPLTNIKEIIINPMAAVFFILALMNRNL